jgi:cysteine synthase
MAGFAGEAFAKIEFLNPMGSVKDRIARFMVEEGGRRLSAEPGRRGRRELVR